MYVYPVKPDEIFHYGIKMRSGRFPWGSGERPKQRLEKVKNEYPVDKEFEKLKQTTEYKQMEMRFEIEKQISDVKNELSSDAMKIYQNKKDNGDVILLQELKQDEFPKLSNEDLEKLKRLGKLHEDLVFKPLNVKGIETEYISVTDIKKALEHSAKGSEWEDHKYVKKINGVYYYPVGYEDGRTIDSLKGGSNKSDSNDKSSQIEEVKKHFDQYLAKRGIDWRTLPKDEVDQMQRDIVKQLESGKEAGTSEKSVEELAKDVASGKLGNGDDRKALLGEKYEEVQKKVNDLLKGSSGDKKVSEETVSEEVKETVKKSTSKVSETKVHSGVKLSEVLSVYDKKK